ncbi:SubName: Full=Uncharacterized protein {ECO:0000313/EMBL:CCA69343.1} [Serendipita indica DSM 11827]|nr:SubName: Full=Uncharacterized protein {ECO:0000313/EMBL:CCA69343.1} [Serendipita indica DSM 11827]
MLPLPSLPSMESRYTQIPANDLEADGLNYKYDDTYPPISGQPPILTFRNRRGVRWTVLALGIFSILFGTQLIYQQLGPPGEFKRCPALVGPVDDSPQPRTPNTDPSQWSNVIPPSRLMQMLAEGETTPRRLIHQSWKTRDNLPEHFQRWSDDWRRIHGQNWTYVLWSDEDNRALVETYYPSYLSVYDSLPKPIYRADMVRNMYMHRFGGIYADLDLVPLANLDVHLAAFYGPADAIPKAYVGHMGKDNFEHSIPNAFMASTGRLHPFWLRPLDFVAKHAEEGQYTATPEALTGPVALRTCVNEWERGATADERSRGHLEVLENGKIYPLNWQGAPKLNWCLCRRHSPWFNEHRCNALYPEAWTITYWTHSW